MIAAWLGDLATPVVAAGFAFAVLALLAAQRFDRPRVWMLPTVPPRVPVRTPDDIAAQVVEELVSRREAAWREGGLRIRAWTLPGGYYVAVEHTAEDGTVYPCNSRVGNTDIVWWTVRDAVELARSERS